MKLQRFMSHNPLRDLPGFFTAFTGQRVVEPDVTNRRQGWYAIRNVKNDKQEDVAEVAIYGYIGSWDISANDFLSELNQITSSKLEVRINSFGGEVSDGLAIYNAMARFNGEVTVFVDGMAASAASFIAQAASEGRLFMSPHSEMLIHDGQGICMGPSADMRKMADWLDVTSNNIAGIYAGRAGGTVENWRAAMQEETLYSDQGAVDAGLADAISSDGDTVAEPAGKEEKPKNNAVDNFDYSAALAEALPEDSFDYSAALREQVPA